MGSQTDAEKLAYVMVILKNTEMPKPDYSAVAVEAGINNANNAYVAFTTYYFPYILTYRYHSSSQKKFRAIVKSAGFDLVEGKVVGADGSGPTPVDPAVTPKRGRGKKADGETPKRGSAKKATNGTPSKKRKLSPPVEDAADGGEDDAEPGEAAAVKDEDDATT